MITAKEAHENAMNYIDNLCHKYLKQVEDGIKGAASTGMFHVNLQYIHWPDKVQATVIETLREMGYTITYQNGGFIQIKW